MTVAALVEVNASVVAIAFVFAGCGGGDDTNANGTGGRGCLSAAAVEKKVDEIASGVEGSDAEVKRIQRQIRELRAQECP